MRAGNYRNRHLPGRRRDAGAEASGAARSGREGGCCATEISAALWSTSRISTSRSPEPAIKANATHIYVPNWQYDAARVRGVFASFWSIPGPRNTGVESAAANRAPQLPSSPGCLGCPGCPGCGVIGCRRRTCAARGGVPSLAAPSGDSRDELHTYTLWSSGGQAGPRGGFRPRIRRTSPTCVF